MTVSSSYYYRTSELQCRTPLLIEYNNKCRGRILIVKLCAAPGKAGLGPSSVSPDRGPLFSAFFFLLTKETVYTCFGTTAVLIDRGGF